MPKHEEERNGLQAEAAVLARTMQGMPHSIALDNMLRREAEIYRRLAELDPPESARADSSRRPGGLLGTGVAGLIATGLLTTTRMLVFIGLVTLVVIVVARRIARR